MNKITTSLDVMIEEEVSRVLGSEEDAVPQVSDKGWLMKLAALGYEGWLSNGKSNYGC